MSHALVVGGTGMLKDATLWLAEEERSVSVIARSESRLLRLVDIAASRGGEINPLAMDYRNNDEVRRAIGAAIDRYGPISTVVSWIHSSAPNCHNVIAEILGGQSVPCRWFDLLGSAVADPSGPGLDKRAEVEHWESIVYRAVILGFVLQDRGSRWLTHQEICTGVIKAVREDLETSVIGQVRPWSMRP